MTTKGNSRFRTLLTGVAAGLLAGVVTGQVEKLTGRLVSDAQKRREKEVREDSAHRMAGPHFARKIVRHDLSEKEIRRARAAFGATYGVMWGLVYAGLRARYPSVTRFLGLPFAVPFFLGCDGAMAPLLGISPGIGRIPWQVNSKELGNHVAWTAAAESVHRLADRISAGAK